MLSYSILLASLLALLLSTVLLALLLIRAERKIRVLKQEIELKEKKIIVTIPYDNDEHS